jgi:hypothetical protein
MEEPTMKIDAYTKTVLTIIAICLVWICVKDVTRSAQANAPQPVIVTGVASGAETSVVIKRIELDAPVSGSRLKEKNVIPVYTPIGYR